MTASPQDALLKRAVELQAQLRENFDDVALRAEIKDLYRQAGRWNHLVDFIKKELAAKSADPSEQLTLLEELVSIYHENLEQEAALIATYRSILQLDPCNEAAHGVRSSSGRATGQDSRGGQARPAPR